MTRYKHWRFKQPPTFNKTEECCRKAFLGAWSQSSKNSQRVGRPLQGSAPGKGSGVDANFALQSGMDAVLSPRGADTRLHRF